MMMIGYLTVLIGAIIFGQPLSYHALIFILLFVMVKQMNNVLN